MITRVREPRCRLSLPPALSRLPLSLVLPVLRVMVSALMSFFRTCAA
jgi:hypothetical protein